MALELSWLPPKEISSELNSPVVSHVAWLGEITMFFVLQKGSLFSHILGNISSRITLSSSILAEPRYMMMMRQVALMYVSKVDVISYEMQSKTDWR